MGTEQDLEAAEYDAQVEIKAPILQKAKSVVTDGYAVENLTGENKKGHEWIVYLTTFVTVCGSFAFGSSIDFSSPIQYTITVDLNLSLAEYSLFGSILNFGAMISAVTSGRIADFIGRKGKRIACEAC